MPLILNLANWDLAAAISDGRYLVGSFVVGRCRVCLGRSDALDPISLGLFVELLRVFDLRLVCAVRHARASSLRRCSSR